MKNTTGGRRAERADLATEHHAAPPCSEHAELDATPYLTNHRKIRDARERGVTEPMLTRERPGGGSALRGSDPPRPA